MADLILVVGETGMNVDFTIIDKETDLPLDLTVFDSITLNISLTDFVINNVTATLTIFGLAIDGVARWAVTVVPITAGAYYAQIVLVDTGTQTRKTALMDFQVVEAVP